MNCQEYRDMIEDALDISLHGELEMRVRRHLEHCEGCRAYFVRRRSEHVSLFTSVNAAYSHLRPPSDGFADRIVREVVARRNARWSWRRIALPRWALIAASLVLMAGFVFAATVVVEAVMSGGSGSSTLPESEAVGRVVPNAPKATDGSVVSETGGTRSVASAEVPSAPSASHVPSADNRQQTAVRQQQSSTNQHEADNGEKEMNINQKAVVTLAAATLAATPVASGAVLSGDASAERIVLTNRVVLVYNANGQLTVNKPGVVDVLVVGGGGGGGQNGTNYGGGGGGAGGVIYRTSFEVTAGSYPVTVGSGGAVGAKGGDSSVFGLIAYGGGYGARTGGNDGGAGASGGGATASTSSAFSGGIADYSDVGNLGHAGGDAGHVFGPGGGGGAGDVGETVAGSTPGAGGDGLSYDIVGTNVWYGGGGAGYRNKNQISGGKGGGGSCVKIDANTSVPDAGTDGLGGGGCGGAAGGRGVVIVSFALDDGLVDTSDFMLTGGDRLIPMLDGTAHVFTNSGTLTVTGEGTVEVLAVGGGGGGGVGHVSNLNYGGAGGGGGGVAHFAALPVTAGTYSIVVGEGGEVDANGGNSTAFGVIAFGGGAGARYDSRSGEANPEPYDGTSGKDGASGGGACKAPYTPSGDYVPGFAGGQAIYALYGNAGHSGGTSTHQYGSGGGGGAGAPGGDGQGSTPGAGGDGLPFTITGSEVYYGGGGAGNRSGNYNVLGGLGGGGNLGEPGRDGLGGGGSGGQKGGSGVVIVRYHRKMYAEEFKDATGGAMKRCKGYRVHTFTESGTFTIPCVGKVEVLLVGGGGGGGQNRVDVNQQGGGGGGGGGVIHTNVVLSAGPYIVTVGAGGAAGDAANTAPNGGDTMAFGLIAYGGGGGARNDSRTTAAGRVGGNGASGGGATHTQSWSFDDVVSGGESIYSAKANLGHAGGSSSHPYGPGGGGGAGTAGGANSSSTPGAGGDGYACDISGEMVYYGGGGAGFGYNKNVAGGKGGGGAAFKDGTGEAGTDGLGGGGCGGYRGGSGVVIVRYRLPPVGTVISIH